MRLTKLKIAGFKSFVDPTHVQFPSNLVGVVGPNGCGKSNIIDAVRWVMGEISAKHLRGDSMADVIFNGSGSRKPLGAASVELIFDNAEGKLGGEYASYREIALRRSVSRDGTSDYYINGAKVRRKDITQLFLGTGLGSRSYAIIEQGMISRIIDAKPDELRAFLEEAAGISRYKERRRETESRIAHTRENLERLQDVREEVDKQIRHLQKQAAAARRYADLQEEARKLHAEILLQRLNLLSVEMSAASTAVNACQLELDARLAELRQAERDIERLRVEQAARAEALSLSQGRFYDAGAAVSGAEQEISHARELRQRHEEGVQQSEAQLAQLDEHEMRDRSSLAQLNAGMEALTPQLNRANLEEARWREAQDSSEAALVQWQAHADAHTLALARTAGEMQVEAARIEQLEMQRARLEAQHEQMGAELLTLQAHGAHDELHALITDEAERSRRAAAAAQELERVTAGIVDQRNDERAASSRLELTRTRWQAARSELIANETLQAAALGSSGGAERWIAEHQLAQRPRIAQQLRVEKGWERAVETVLGPYLEAVCVDDLDAAETGLATFDAGYLTLVTPQPESAHLDVDALGVASLAQKVHNSAAVDALLAPIGAVDSLSMALGRRRSLPAGFSLVTRDGVWVGRNWLRISRGHDPHEGMIEREEALRMARAQTSDLANELARQEADLLEVRSELERLEERRDTLQFQVNDAHRAHVEVRARLENRQIQIQESARRIESMQAQRRAHEEDLRLTRDQLESARQKLSTSGGESRTLENAGSALETQRESLRAAHAENRSHAHTAQVAARDLAVQLEAKRSSHAALLTTLERGAQQRESLTERRRDALQAIENGARALLELQDAVNSALARRLAAEEDLRSQRAAADAAEADLRARDSERMSVEHAVERWRNEAQQAHLMAQQARLRHEGIDEQIQATGFDRAQLTADLPADAQLEPWEQRLLQTRERIERLGPVNLAAIDEFKSQSERKEYLDRQNQDLTEALELLESAMRKIDRETRSRFQETFERVNLGLRQKFPRLFGGGDAYLELAGEDTLAAGVSIMARPPGKRNSSISQLSGGEKALTAVALVFSIFELNPAPFCLLDEVDAPLDENNVGRFCDIVREMAKRVQFIFITHNKSTMETASQLIGVTMNEPGVSRLVAVDVDEAVRLAAS